MVDYEKMGQDHANAAARKVADETARQQAARDKVRAQLVSSQGIINDVVVPELERAKEGLAKSNYELVYDTADMHGFKVAAAFNIAKGRRFLTTAYQIQPDAEGFKIFQFGVTQREPLNPRDVRAQPLDVTEDLLKRPGNQTLDATVIGIIVQRVLALHP